MAEQQTITIEVDGRPLTARPGQMLIEVTDAAGIDIPRFCYHKKLSVAANCRMCLVEVEKAPKPLPACATPVADGMKVYTHSPLARRAQKDTMEFLLINHPLDCPICDQGGECELQDVAMGYGGDVSRFSERKRVVRDENIGSLIATDMTRCIHCTRCVRFGGEIAGLRELGATGRGEHMRIGVFVEHSVASELSGNIVDLCPVGALTSKPYRFTARAWELTQHDGLALHDGLGSNLFLHVRRGELMRVVPRENEAVNETWISDRDRFSYQGLYAPDRVARPLVRHDGKLREVDWQEALEVAAGILEGAAGRLGTLVSPSATLEEMFLAQQLTRALGSPHVDHRLRQCDFRAAAADPALPWLGARFADIERADAVLLVGSWLRKDVPLLNHRLRKAAREGASVMTINPVAYDFNYDIDVDIVAPPSRLAEELAGVAAVLGADTCGIAVEPDASHRGIADALREARQGHVLLGAVALNHPDFTVLRALAAGIAAAAGVTLGFVLEGGNGVGGWLCGAVPHRLPNGDPAEPAGHAAAAMLAEVLDAYLLLGVEPEHDVADPMAAQTALAGAKVVALATHMSPALEASADVVLPVAGFAETSGTLVNLQGDRQSFEGSVAPVGEARPAWKVLRVLGNQLGLPGFDYLDSREVRDAALAAAGERALDNACTAGADERLLLPGSGLERVGGVPAYAVDATVRRAAALQRTPDAWPRGLRVCTALADSLGLADGETALLQQSDVSTTLPVWVDDRVPEHCVWLPAAVPGAELLSAAHGSVTLEKA